jgi:hypothetical protein
MGVHDSQALEQVQERLSQPLNDIVGRARRAKVVRRDLEVGDLGMIIVMLCAVAEIAGDADPELWRRYLTLTLDGIKPGGSKLPVKALDEQAMRDAVANHKQAIARSTGNAR